MPGRIEEMLVRLVANAFSRQPGLAKAKQVIAFARAHRHPLQCVIERRR
jgi:ATP-dependent Clp protease adapter protein ClpS